jgi:hypothetical protein
MVNGLGTDARSWMGGQVGSRQRQTDVDYTCGIFFLDSKECLKRNYSINKCHCKANPCVHNLFSVLLHISALPVTFKTLTVHVQHVMLQVFYRFLRLGAQ